MLGRVASPDEDEAPPENRFVSNQDVADTGEETVEAEGVTAVNPDRVMSVGLAPRRGVREAVASLAVELEDSEAVDEEFLYGWLPGMPSGMLSALDRLSLLAIDPEADREEDVDAAQ